MSMFDQLRALPRAVSRSIIDSHAVRDVYHPHASFVLLALVLLGTLSGSIVYRVLTVTHSTSTGHYDASSVSHQPIGYTSFQEVATQSIADNGFANITWNFEANILATEDSDCTFLIDTYLADFAGAPPGELLVAIQPLQYSYSFEPPNANHEGNACSHEWQFAQSVGVVSLYVSIFAVADWGSDFCPSYGTSNSSDLVWGRLMVSSQWPMRTCEVVGMDGDFDHTAVLTSMVDSDCSNAPGDNDDCCYSWAMLGNTVPQIMRNHSLDRCYDHFYTKTVFLNTFAHRTGALDAIALTFSLLSLMFAISKFAITQYNSREERRFGIITDRDEANTQQEPPKPRTHSLSLQQRATHALNEPLIEHDPLNPANCTPLASLFFSLPSHPFLLVFLSSASHTLSPYILSF